jgi:hypothetical protein
MFVQQKIISTYRLASPAPSCNFHERLVMGRRVHAVVGRRIPEATFLLWALMCRTLVDNFVS